jgi:hypothetical protein
MTICEKFGTNGKGVDVGSITRVGAGVAEGITMGVRVGGKGVGADSVKTGWQAEARKDAMIVIQIKWLSFFIAHIIRRSINVLESQVHSYSCPEKFFPKT